MISNVNEKLKNARGNDVQLFFITRKKKKDAQIYNVHKAEITAELGAELLNHMQTRVAMAADNKDMKFTKYAPNNSRQGEVTHYLPKISVHNLQQIEEQLVLLKLPRFIPGSTKTPVAYVLAVNGLYAYRKYSAKKVLEAGATLTLLYTAGRFNKLNKSAVIIDKTIDCISDGENIFIFDDRKFEQIFSFIDLFVSAIERKLPSSNAANVISNLNDFQKLCVSDAKKVRMLYGIIDANSDLVTVNNVRQVNEDFSLGLTLNAQGQLVADKASIWQVLNILDDSYLFSRITQNKYEVHAKVKR